jgi:hypothetical protein
MTNAEIVAMLNALVVEEKRRMAEELAALAAIATAPVADADRMLLDLIERLKFRVELSRRTVEGALADDIHGNLEAAGVSNNRIVEIIESAQRRGVIKRKNCRSGTLYMNGEEWRARLLEPLSKTTPAPSPRLPFEVYPRETDMSIPNTQFWRTGRRR